MKGTSKMLLRTTLIYDPVRRTQVVWIRGLYESWLRMNPSSDAAKFVQSYLYVQVCIPLLAQVLFRAVLTYPNYVAT